MVTPDAFIYLYLLNHLLKTSNSLFIVFRARISVLCNHTPEMVLENVSHCLNGPHSDELMATSNGHARPFNGFPV